ncbi:MAG: YcgN family cysteine cluster protein [Gammaproteobacteria bacterium]|nr:YcgN family cysteine cluster protein [Gammaproteobacteria bacterium]
MARFWEEKTLAQLSREEWEQLCDGCARCCLIKLEDEEDGTLYTTSLVCRHLDIETGACSCYTERTLQVPECLQVTAQNAATLKWMPQSCAYRLLAEGRALPAWHPLISGRCESVHEAGISVAGFAISEAEVEDEEQWQDYIIDHPE